MLASAHLNSMEPLVFSVFSSRQAKNKVKPRNVRKNLQHRKNIEQKQKKTKRWKKQENTGGQATQSVLVTFHKNKACVRLDFRVEGFKFLVQGSRFLDVLILGLWRKGVMEKRVQGFGVWFKVLRFKA